MTQHIIASIPNLPDPDSAVIEVKLVSDLIVWASNTTQSVERGHVATPVPYRSRTQASGESIEIQIQ